MQKSWSIMLLTAIGAAPVVSEASVLTFDTGVGFQEHGFVMPQDYGDAVGSGAQCNQGGAYRYGEGTGFTPNVSVSYSAEHGSAPDTAVTSFFDAEWIQVACLLSAASAANVQNLGTERNFDFVFTPDQGFGVRINSFVLDDYDGFAAGHEVDWAIYSDFVMPGSELASGSVILDADEERQIQTGLTGFNARTLILRITHVSGDGTDLALDDLDFEQASVLGVGDPPSSGRAVLHLARPNPFSRHTTIQFDLPIGATTRLAIFDANGRRVRGLVNRNLTAGAHTADWDGLMDNGARAEAGVYFYRLQVDGYVARRKFVLIR